MLLTGRPASSGHRQIYFGEPARSPDQKSLELWLQSDEAHSRRILLILDDLDGIDVSLRKRIRRHLVTSAADCIFTTRDPLMAAKGGDWDAVSFEVPRLEEPASIILMRYLMSGNPNGEAPERELTELTGPSFQAYPELTASTVKADPENDVMSQVVNRLGGSPAAILISCGFAKAHHVSQPVHECLRQFLRDWTPEDLVMYRWDDMTYPYTLCKSFELSKSRLLRNTSESQPYPEYKPCILILLVLSALDLDVFGDGVMKRLCTYFESLLNEESPLLQPLRTSPKNSFIEDLKTLTKESRLRACITQLTRVSLLKRIGHDSIRLDALTRICALRMGEQADIPSGLLDHVRCHSLLQVSHSSGYAS